MCVYKMRNRLLPSLLQTRKLLHEYLKPRINNIITYSQLKQVKKFSTDNVKKPKDDENVQSSSHNLTNSMSSNYKVFDDKDSEIILDIDEKQETVNLETLISDEKYFDLYEGINLKRGINGVFEIEDLVSLLQRDNAKNIFVASVPPELCYVNYIVVVTGNSQKHMLALATFIRKIYKLKKNKTDWIPKIEGTNSKAWIALDLGNIALHIFSKSARLVYDLETLWSVGPDYDDKSKNPVEDVMEQYNTILLNIKPIEESDKIDKSDNK